MKLYAGIDLHSSNSYLAIMNEKQEVLYKKRWPNELGLILSALAPYQKNLDGVVVESTYNWYWLVDGLQEHGYVVHLAHPAAGRQYEGLKHADDKSDACWLAKQLLLGILETGYMYPKESRGMREILRQRMNLVRQRTQTLLRIQSQITRYMGKTFSAAQIKKLDHHSVKNIMTDVYACQTIINHLKVMQTQSKAIDDLEKFAQKSIKNTRELKLLKTTPGIGNILAMLIYVETGTTDRFKSSRHYSSYCRCVESKRVSNGKKKGENNRKNGNAYLSWAFMEAANDAIRYHPTIKKYYQKRITKVHRVVALKCVAHKLAQATYCILKNQEEFDVNKAF